MIIRIFKPEYILSFFLFITFFCAILTAYIRISATMTGYAIGDLKDQEFELLEEKSRLRMKIATLTKKENLMILAQETKGLTDKMQEFASQ